MLQDYLYSLQSLSDTSARVRLLPESPIYAAHFKGMPVTPGACLIQMACELVGASCGRSFEMKEASDIRFVHPVLTGEITELEFQYSRPQPEEKPDLWTVQVLAGDILCSRMKFTVTA